MRVKPTMGMASGNLKSAVLAVFAAVAADAAVLQPFTIPDGGVFTVSGVYENPVSGSVATNRCSYEIDNDVLVKALGDATIKVTRPQGATEGALYFTTVATNGTLTLDLTEWEGLPFRIDGGVFSGGEGSIVVKGRDSLDIGCTWHDFRSGFGDIRTRPIRNSSRPVAFRNVSFIDADGNGYENPAGIVLSGSFWDAGIAADATCPWSVAGNAIAVTDFPRGFIGRYVKDGILELSTFDVWVLNPEAFADVTSVKVHPGRELRVIPRTVLYPASEDGTRNFGWNGYSYSPSEIFTNSVELLGEGAYLTLNQHYSMIFGGDVTGTGTMRIMLEHQNGSGRFTQMTGDLDYTGPLEMSLASVATNYTLRLTDQVTDLSRNPVTLSDGAELYLGFTADSVALPAFTSVTHRTGTPMGTISLAKGIRDVTVGQAGPRMRFSGDFSAASNRVTVLSMPYGGAVYDNSRVEVVPGSGVTGTVRLENPAGGVLYRMEQGASTVPLWDLALGAEGEYAVAANDGMTVERPAGNTRVEVPADASATVLTLDTEPTVVVSGGSVALGIADPDDGWKENVMLWLDPSQSGSWVYWTYDGKKGYDDSGLYGTVGPWGDWREGKGDSYLINDKHYHEAGNTICPFAVTNGLNGMTYISFARNSGGKDRYRRMSFYPEGYTNMTDTSGAVPISPKFAIMVFGSQNGGGQALFANASGYYKRGGTLKRGMSHENPVFADASIPTWMDGERIDPSARNLSGGWQIISVDTSKASVSGLGYVTTTGNTTGMSDQNYAEIIFFDKVLSDTERVTVEMYLAEKWGLGSIYNAPVKTVKATLHGTGSVTMRADFEMSGTFSGTVDLGGRTLSFADARFPPTADDVAAVEGRVGWFDPEDENRTVLIHRDGQQSVRRIFDRDADMSSAAGALCLDSVSRDPMLAVGARGCGPERRWIDYSSSRFPSSVQGKSLRLQEYTGKTENQYRVDSVTARTVFLVQDSSRGGGTPFMSTVGDTGTQLSPRLTKFPDMPPDPSFPVWRNKSAMTFRDGATYLDGRKVDGLKQGFNARPELLTAVGGVDFPFGALGYCLYMDDVAVDVRPDVGEIQGEVMVYDRVLSDDDRRTVEAYLMHKWLGTVNGGYGVYTNVTVGGDGKVVVKDPRQMPRLAADFTGSVEMASETLSFTVSGGVVADALDFGTHEVSFPSECTVRVTFTPSAKTGTYRLVTSGGDLSGTEWILDATSASGTFGRRRVHLEVSGGNVDVCVEPAGLILNVR